MKKLYRAITAIVLCSLCGWVAYTEVVRDVRLQTVANAERKLQNELDLVEAVKQNQKYAKILANAVNELSKENVTFYKVVQRAKQVVSSKDQELCQTKDALAKSVELLKEQIEENNRCVDYIRKLEDMIRRLMAKIPEKDRPAMPSTEKTEKIRLPLLPT